MGEWKTVRHIEDTKGKTEHYTCELWLKFPKSLWNKSEESPVIKITYSDRKYEETYWLDKEKTKSYTIEPRKSCVIEVNYIQRHTQVVLYSGTHDEPNYKDFTLEYCKSRAEKIFTDRLMDLVNQMT